MKVRVLKAAIPKALQWVDIENGSAAQSENDPSNIVLKAGNSLSIRLTKTSMGPIGSQQHPGSASMWYVCEVEIQVVPVVPV